MSEEITSKQITHHFEITNAKIERLNQDVLGLQKSQNEMHDKLDQVIEAISVLADKINYIDTTNAHITRDIYNLNRKV